MNHKGEAILVNIEASKVDHAGLPAPESNSTEVSRQHELGAPVVLGHFSSAHLIYKFFQFLMGYVGTVPKPEIIKGKYSENSLKRHS